MRSIANLKWWVWLIASLAVAVPTAIQSVDAGTSYKPQPVPESMQIRLCVQWAIAGIFLLLALLIGLSRLLKLVKDDLRRTGHPPKRPDTL
jgi:hypothetical protein